MSDGFSVSLSELDRAIDQYAEATGKDEATILNRVGRNVALRTAKNTPKKSAAEITADIFKDPHLRYAMASIALKKKGVGTLKSPQFAAAVQKWANQRRSSGAYLAAGFAKAGKVFGANGSRKKFRGADGSGRKATARHLVAELEALLDQPDEKHAQGAEDMISPALEEAIRDVAADMINYANSLLAKTAKKYSG